MTEKHARRVAQQMTRDRYRCVVVVETESAGYQPFYVTPQLVLFPWEPIVARYCPQRPHPYGSEAEQ